LAPYAHTFFSNISRQIRIALPPIQIEMERMAAEHPPGLTVSTPESGGADGLPLSEAEWRALLAGDDAARARLYGRYADPLYRAIRAWAHRLSAEDAEELLAETFVQALRSIQSVRSPAQLESWLFKLARNRVIDFCRTRGRAMKELRLDALSPGARDRVMDAIATDAAGDALAKLASEEERATLSALVEQILTELPVRQQQALLDKYLNGKSLEQIAASFGLAPDAVASLLHRARSSFRGIFEKRAGKQ
jgi:RNA polymerase sigma-70 factor (ECF subfamily)